MICMTSCWRLSIDPRQAGSLSYESRKGTTTRLVSKIETSLIPRLCRPAVRKAFGFPMPVLNF
jgi:hypothetical protein